MEVKELPNIVLIMVAVAMLLAVGVLVVSNLGDASKVPTAVTLETITWDYLANVSLAKGNVTGVTALVNSSLGGACPTSYIIYGEGILNGVSKLYATANNSDCYDGVSVNVSYVYNDYDTSTYSVTQTTASALTPIATTWMGLIITIIILSIILIMVIKSFAQGR